MYVNDIGEIYGSQSSDNFTQYIFFGHRMRLDQVVFVKISNIDLLFRVEFRFRIGHFRNTSGLVF